MEESTVVDSPRESSPETNRAATDVRLLEWATAAVAMVIGIAFGAVMSWN